MRSLFENALYFSSIENEKVPEVAVQFRDRGTGVEICVEDNGIGIEPELQPRIWDMFFKASEYSHGNGLGLFIVRKAVEALRGEINVDSQPESYARFTVTIPHLEVPRNYSRRIVAGHLASN